MKLVLVLCSLLFVGLAFAQNGHPGVVPNWSSAKKIQVGTTNDHSKSFVWFTNTQGILTETYFPTIDAAQIKDAQILVTDGNSFMVEERTSTEHKVEVIHPSLVKMNNRDWHNRFEISHTFYSAKDKSILIDEVIVDAKIDGLKFYQLVNPALNNTGYNDNGYVYNGKIHFYENDSKFATYTSVGYRKTSLGYVGFTDGFQDLNSNFQMNNNFHNIYNGNIASTGEINIPQKKGIYKFYIIYNFEKDATTLSTQFLAQQKREYQRDWDSYLNKLKMPKNLNKKHTDLYLRSLYTLRVHEDKKNPGALIASLSKPWGDETFEYPGVFTGGYHLVWPRDLYHVCTAYVNAGDLDTPRRALGFLKRIQYKYGTWNFQGRSIDKYGAFPQNVWTTGKEYWGGYQLDQTAYPIHIFYQLWKRANEFEKDRLMKDFGGMIHDALAFISKNGVWSAQERWEENFGISPSSFSAAASAMMMGSDIFGDDSFKNTARGWLTKPYDNIHSWTFTNQGKLSDGQYYIRVAGCSSHAAQWDPNNGHWCTIANSGQKVEQTRIVDQGFLKLALLGLVPANDWRIKHSKDVVDQHIRVKTPNGHGWYRYSYDAYGESKRGRLWPLLSGEHGRFAIERYVDGDLSWNDANSKVDAILETYSLFANDGQMIPEQVWEHTGEGTGAATPLAWSHAEYIKLLWSKDKKENVENLLR